jgi:hypothetical protein
MAEMILPGVYIEVRPEGLIVPGRVSVGTLGMVGTASKGPIGEPKLLGTYTEAREVFGYYDAWVDGKSNELTLVRALELAFKAGASRAFAVRVSSMAGAPPKPTAVAATFTLDGDTAGETVAVLTASEPGTWGNSVGVNVWDAEDDAFLREKTVSDGVAAIKVSRAAFDAANVRNRVRIKVAATGQTKVLTPMPAVPPDAAVLEGKFRISEEAGHQGELIFHANDNPQNGDEVVVSYVVPKGSSRKVTLRYGNEEVYTIADGNHLVELLADPDGPSALASGGPGTNPEKLPKKNTKPDEFLVFGQPPDKPGSDGADATPSDYTDGLDALLAERAHIIVAAGQDDSFGDELANHCATASSDRWKKDRIAVVGSKVKASFDDIRQIGLDSDRVIFVAPGIKVTDAASKKTVTLPGAYTAAFVAGLLSARDPHVSLTNKPVQVDELEIKFTMPQLEALVSNRVLAIEERRELGRRVVQGITTSTNTAWKQITTRRIVDYAKYGVRSAAEPYIGLLNNERVRGALRATVNSFLAEMVEDEMLIQYRLEVTATRDEERKGICRVTMTLQPTFSIDYIKVTMFLE